MPRPSHSSWFDHPKNIWWGLQITRLLIMYFCPALCTCSLSGPWTSHSTISSGTLSSRLIVDKLKSNCRCKSAYNNITCGYSLQCVRAVTGSIKCQSQEQTNKRVTCCTGRSHWGRNVGWGCLRIGCWGEYLGLGGTRWQGSAENYIKRSLMIFTAHPLLFGW